MLAQLAEQRRLVLADPAAAHRQLHEAVGHGWIDHTDPVFRRLLRDERDTNGNLTRAGEVLARFLIDPRIALYRRNLSEGLAGMRAQAMNACAHAPVRVVPRCRPRRRRSRRSGARASPARPDDADPADLATRLQRAQQQLARSVLDARELDERGFAVFVDFAAQVIAREAARVTRWEQRQ